jgi:pyruvate/2-oxoglutarate dehydrogenase complex dihydrolipoamide acyltransferase (E2) component
MSRMRRTISDRMIQSKQYSAHVHTCFEVDYTRVDALRRKYKNPYGRTRRQAHLHHLHRARHHQGPASLSHRQRQP